MADIAISYAHGDAAAAYRLRDALTSAHHTVWIDTPGEELVAGIALPGGQRHQDVIFDEFARADVVVVVDTPLWHSRPYCRDEYEFLREYGKWVAFYAPDGPCGDADNPHPSYRTIAEMEAALRTRRALARAHSRLVQLVRTGHPSNRPTIVDRFLRRTDAQDAADLLAVRLEDYDLALNAAMDKHARDTDDATRTAQRKLLRGSTSVIIVLALLATAGIVALFFAARDENAAHASAAHAQSLDLASRSGQEGDSAKALDLARQGHDLSENAFTTDALAVATANHNRLSTVAIDTQQYFGAVLAPKAPLMVAHTTRNMRLINIDTGATVATLDVPESDSGIKAGAVALSANGSTVAYVDLAGDLWLSRLAGAGPRTLLDRGVIALRTSNGTDLWFSSGGHNLAVSTFPDIDAGRFEPKDVGAASTAMSIAIDAEQRSLDYLGSDGRVHETVWADGGIRESDSFPVVPADSIGTAPAKPNTATVTRCGKNLFGAAVVGSKIRATRFARVDGVLSLDEGGGRPSSAICSADDLASYGDIGGPLDGFRPGDPVPTLPSGAERYIPALDPTGARRIVITPDGRLFRLGSATIRSREQEIDAMALITLPNAEYIIVSNGDIVNSQTAQVTGRTTVMVPDTVSVLGSTAMFVSRAGITRVDRDGRPTVISPAETGQATQLRTGGDSKHFVATMPKSVLLLDEAGNLDRTVALPWLDDTHDGVADADVMPDGRHIVIATLLGRIALVDVDSGVPRFWDRSLAAAGRDTHVLVVPQTGQIVIAPSDGIVRLLDGNLELVTDSFLGDATNRLTIADNAILAVSPRVGAVVYDARSLHMIDHITADVLSSTIVQLSSTDRSLHGLRAYTSNTVRRTRHLTVPLPFWGTA